MITNWIAVDWGTTNVRAYAMSDKQEVITDTRSIDGAGKLSSNEFENALLKLIEDWLLPNKKMTILICGMAGSKQGWTEVNYLHVPCQPSTSEGIKNVLTRDARIDVFILPGVCQLNPYDVMRGEETQLAGLMSHKKSTFNSVCLPGTHCKWAQLQDKKINSFTTYMTGEFFGLLSQYSILRHEVTSEHWNQLAFLDAIEESFKNPQQILSECFRIRSRSLLSEFDSASSRAKLSGLMIGLELAGATSYWENQYVAIIGDNKLTHLYAGALGHLGCKTEIFSAKKMTLIGLIHVYKNLFNQ